MGKGDEAEDDDKGKADPQAKTISASLKTALRSEEPRLSTLVTPVLQQPSSSSSSSQANVNASAGTSSEEGPQLIGGRYELLGMLGAGAMGTVYRARDCELDEIVALKVLKRELASKDMIERFRREVKLARRVTHKNVARTFDIGEHGGGSQGDRFLTMEFIDGEMLGALLARRRRLPVSEVARIALDICRGLAAAHAANVLHRDLKPENVILAKDGRGAVITDFGIARAVAEGELSRTAGGIVGTPAYMAPEQVEGSTDLDARADLYALGTMLFELLTGEMAWTGDSIVTIAAGRLLRPPPDPRTIVPTLPDNIAELVLKLMARKREDRFSTADETAYALDVLGATAASVVPKPTQSSGTLPLLPLTTTSNDRAREGGARVVVVLPIVNLGATDDVYLVDNINEDIVDLLSVVPGLLVRPRGDTARFHDPKRDVREIGIGLDADVVVDGSLRRIGGDGEMVRASFRLIAVQDGFQLWARRFDRPPSQVLSIADDAAHAIARALTTELAPLSQRNVPGADPEAEELFLRGRYLLRRGWHGSARQAVEILGRAHERAPDDARIVGTYALALSKVFGMEFFEPNIADRARELAVRALELDPRLAEPKVALATVAMMNTEGDAAITYLFEALQLQPNCIEAIDWLGRISGEVGLIAEGVALLERVIALDRDTHGSRTHIARIRAMSGDRRAADQMFQERPTDPNDTASWLLMLAREAVWYRDQKRGLELLALIKDLELPQAARFPIQGMLEIVMGRGERFADLTLMDRVLPIDSHRPPRRNSFHAQLRAELLLSTNYLDRAMEAVTTSDLHGLFDIVWLNQCPLLEPLRSRPDFKTVHDRVAMRAGRVAAALQRRLSRASSGTSQMSRR